MPYSHWIQEPFRRSDKIDCLRGIGVTDGYCFGVFEYCYRDASNYKAWGVLLIERSGSEELIERIVSSLESREFFIAEQVGILPMYGELWKFSGGPNTDDHVWHEFHQIRQPTNEEHSLPVWGTANELADRFSAVKEWNEQLSPHWNM